MCAKKKKANLAKEMHMATQTVEQKFLEREEDGKPTRIMCPLTNFRRPVAACLIHCPEKHVNWCQNIKKVAIEDLDLAASDLQDLNKESWKDRRDFFTQPVLAARDDKDSEFDPEVNGGGGVGTQEDIGVYYPDKDVADEAQDGEDNGEFPVGPYPEEPEEEEKDEFEAEGEYLAEPDEVATGDENQSKEEDHNVAKKFKCPQCGKDDINTERGLKIHISRTHKKGKGKSDAPAAKKKKAPSSKSRKSSGEGRYVVMVNSTCSVADSAEGIPGILEQVRAEADDDDGMVTIFEIAREVKVNTRVEVDIEEV